MYSHPAAVAYAQAHPKRTIPKFGPYLLLQTLGEGEFGKVKLGLHCQWGEEVAVKLIRRGNIDSAVRMTKVEREIEVLRSLKHPNIVRLYDVIETDKYIGIIIEYASGGELFDHILAHRYLREKDAAKLFSQLVSGVWYIHQKKIVHRDLKLENLLLDRNRNVLITDFGFANRFEHRSDDLMQTSCGSPCYAAPELVISEGLYVGSAVDIWSCGVILYAMLAGYLPFDDDPANPDGDNINLLYKYIVNTPLSFPDYISDSARSLLALMLVPDPSRRASLDEVMAHPWLSSYSKAREDDYELGPGMAFGRTVDDLENAAMEQHQQKRLAYQRQMRNTMGQRNPQPDKPSRTHSQRVEPISNPPSTSRSHSAAQQGSLLYETSPEPQSAPYPATANGYDNGLDNDDPFAAPPGVAAEIPEKKKAARPHTVQVEYNAPRDRPSKRPEEIIEQERERRQRQTTEKPRRPSVSEDKPLPEAPRARTTSQMSASQQRRRPETPPSINVASPPESPAVFSTSQTAEKEDGSQMSRTSSKHSRSPSAVAKLFTSDSSANGSTMLSPSANEKNVADSPTTEKKSRRSSLTVMINKTIKGRKNRQSTAPPSAADRTLPEPVVTPATPQHPPSAYYNEVTTRVGRSGAPGDADEQAPVDGMPASTGKARKVMQWFRSRSKARESSGIMDDGSENSGYVDRYEPNQVAEPEEMSDNRATSVLATPSHRSSKRPGSVQPQRTPSTATDHSSGATTPGFVARFRNSVTVGGGSGRAGGSGGERDEKRGNMLRIHHGAVDQDMITTRPPPEVIKHVKQVLLGMGMEVQLESEYKYRCIRAKRRKAPGQVGVPVGSTGGLAAVTMMGSAASNGVDRRGLPIPGHSTFSSGSGMLRGLLMRRQSSQVSSSGALEEDPSSGTVIPSDGSMLEPMYGDHTHDVGDEVRFSVELTRIDRLSETYSLDIRRLKGNLRSYKFLYDTVRVRAELQR